MSRMISEYQAILSDLAPSNANLVAVSKRQSLDKLQELYDLGHRVFGENRVEEFLEKKSHLPSDIEWHFIGHLQSKKVDDIIGLTTLIHSVDRYKLARIINEKSAAKNVHTKILLQIKIADEDSKYGYNFDILKKELSDGKYNAFSNLTICGLMGMATFTKNQNQVQSEFKRLAAYFEELKADYFSIAPDFKEISMGMSGDYHLALSEGSTMVRVGSKLFGARNY